VDWDREFVCPILTASSIRDFPMTRRGMVKGDFADGDFPVQRQLVKAHIYLFAIHRDFISRHGIIKKSIGNVI
jgi:hypothetical protein